jgi:hypothetical protein
LVEIYINNRKYISNFFIFKIKKSYSKNWSVHGEISKYFAKYEEDKHAEGNELKTPKEEADSAGEREEEVRIVKHLQRDYKCLGRMKHEGEEEGQCSTRTDTECWSIHVEEEEEGMDMEEGTSQGTRRRRSRGTFYRFPERELVIFFILIFNLLFIPISHDP